MERNGPQHTAQPCRLCADTGFVSREDWLRHANEEHGLGQFAQAGDPEGGEPEMGEGREGCAQISLQIDQVARTIDGIIFAGCV